MKAVTVPVLLTTVPAPSTATIDTQDILYVGEKCLTNSCIILQLQKLNFIPLSHAACSVTLFISHNILDLCVYITYTQQDKLWPTFYSMEESFSSHPPPPHKGVFWELILQLTHFPESSFLPFLFCYSPFGHFPDH